MKRKILLCILSTAMALCACGLLACGGEEPIHVHEYEWTITAEANCTTNGERVGVCSCGETKTEVIPASHSYNDGVVTVEPDCTTKGEKFFTCTVCGDTYTQEISAKGHTPANAVKENVIEASCIDDGSYDSVIYCNVCYEELSRETKVIPAKGHTEVIDSAVEPSCTESGLTEGKHCSVCEEILVAQEVINATGHNVENGVCTRCGEIEVISTEGLSFKLNNEKTEYSVWAYTGKATEVVIGSTYEGLPVTGITVNAFEDCSDITSIQLPDSLKYISMYSFKGCSGLTEIVVPESVTHIDGYAFYGCTSLEKITVPFIGDAREPTYGYFGYIFGKNTFNNDNSHNSDFVPRSLKTIVITGGSVVPAGTIIIGSAFYNCSNVTSIEIPEDVTAVGSYAFYGCRNLTSIELPKNITNIGDWAFAGCNSLTEFTVPDKVTRLGGTFGGCTGLKTIIISKNVTDIGYNTFYNCGSLSDVYYKGTAEEWDQISIDGRGTSSLTNATRYYYTETEPTDSGNFWHYVEGEPTIW